METEKLSKEVWEELPGDSIELSDGVTYYQLEGSPDGELVVLVHGMTIPSFIWELTSAALVEEGFQVLRYDLFGRGFSDRPSKTHHLDLYTRQLSELLQRLGFQDEMINLGGFSMGAGISAAYTLGNLNRVRRLMLFDPLHPIDMPAPPSRIWKLLLKIRAMALVINNQIVDSLGNNFHDYESFPDFEDKFYTQLLYKGYALSVMSSMMDFEFERLAQIYEEVGKSVIPIALFWGEEDKLAFFENSSQFLELMPSAAFYPIAEAGHLSFYEQPDLVNPLLLEFLNKRQS